MGVTRHWCRCAFDYLLVPVDVTVSIRSVGVTVFVSVSGCDCPLVSVGITPLINITECDLLCMSVAHTVSVSGCDLHCPSKLVEVTQ